MKVTIIIPSYNQELYLADAIESALSQTVPCEVMVINDGSTDSSLAIAKGYEKQGVKVIDQENQGLSTTRNNGIKETIGDFIFPLDADDILLDDCVEKLLKVMEEKEVDIVAPSFKEFGVRNGQIILGDPTLQDFLSANRIGYFSLIRKSKILEVGGYSVKMKWGYEDYHMWINLLYHGAKLVTLKEVLVLYRTKENSMIHDAQAHHEELMAQIQEDFKELYV